VSEETADERSLGDTRTGCRIARRLAVKGLDIPLEAAERNVLPVHRVAQRWPSPAQAKSRAPGRERAGALDWRVCEGQGSWPRPRQYRLTGLPEIKEMAVRCLVPGGGRLDSPESGARNQNRCTTPVCRTGRLPPCHSRSGEPSPGLERSHSPRWWRWRWPMHRALGGGSSAALAPQVHTSPCERCTA
jgi:hypothetical protein